MASSSSANKVARVAAKSGAGSSAGAPTKNSRNWLFALGIVAIVGLGLAIVAFARNTNEGLGANDVAPKANLNNGDPFDHWHAAFAVNVCGTEVTPLQDGATDPLGIHTHGDGLIHIHPFLRTAAGKRATMAKYFGQVGITVTDEGFQLPDGMTLEDGGTTVEEGVTTCGGKPGEIVMAHWKDAKNAASTPPDNIITEDFSSIRYSEDLGAYTLAYVAKGSKDIPAPSSAAEIDTLGAADGAAPASSDATVPVDTGSGG